ncbi:MAG: hypothetical protein HY553_12410 [Elusimicrobia bacterium]|nr:hypothetical protein [Elusimicrobiota bacterium]
MPGPIVPEPGSGTERSAPSARNRLLAAALAVAALATAWWLGRPRTEEPLAPAPFPAPAPAAPVAAVPEAPADRLPPELLGFDDFVRELGLEGERPALASLAKPFKEKFMAEPVLRETYERFRKADRDGKKPSARAFIATLRSLPEFKKVAAPFVFSTAGTTAFAALARNPQLREVMAGEKALMARAAAAKRAAAVAAAGPQTSKALARFDGPARFGSEPAGGLRAGAVGDEAAVRTERAFASGRADEPAKEKAHEVKPDLKHVDVVQKDCAKQDLTSGIPWLRELSQLGPGGRDAFETAFAQYGQWGACFARKLYARCKAACEESWRYKAYDAECREIPGRKVTCNAPEGGWGEGGFQACLEWLGTAGEERCIDECKAQPPCAVPADILAKYAPKKEPGTVDGLIDARDKSCAEYSAGRGWKPLCDLGEGSCGRFTGGTARTSDCVKCCDATSACGEIARQRGWPKAACQLQGHPPCGARGVPTWDCDRCCLEVGAQSCGEVGRLEGWARAQCGGCRAPGVQTADCADCCNPDW